PRRGGLADPHRLGDRFHPGPQFQSGGAAIRIVAGTARHGRHHRPDADGVRAHRAAGRLPEPRAQPQDRRRGASAVSDDENRTDDDAYVIEDDGASVEQIEREMKEAARAAASEPPSDEAAAAVEQDLREFRDRYVRTLADFENFRK